MKIELGIIPATACIDDLVRLSKTKSMKKILEKKINKH